MRRATCIRGVCILAQSTIMNCSAPEMDVALVVAPHTAGIEMPLCAARSTPAANPMARYPIITGSELIKARLTTGEKRIRLYS